MYRFKKYIRYPLLFCGVLLLYILFSVVIPPLFRSDEVSGDNRLDIFRRPAGERVRCIDKNEQALSYRLQMIQNAKEDIILSTYTLRTDTSGNEILGGLLDATSRGVHVKVVVDGFNGLLHLQHNEIFKAFASSPLVEVKIYNPMNLLTPWKFNYRLHDKYLIIDDSLYLLGGRNISDLYLRSDLPKENIDRDLLVYTETSNRENSINSLKDYFEGVWNLPDTKLFSPREKNEYRDIRSQLLEEYQTAKRNIPISEEEINWISKTSPVKSVTLLHNPIKPHNKEPLLLGNLHDVMEYGDRTIIETPYIICDKPMYEMLHDLTSKGKQIQVLTNAVESGSNPWGCTDYLNQKPKLLDAGLEIMEYLGKQSMHTKTILVDDNISIIGSYNFDIRSTYLNTELMLVVDSGDLNQELKESMSKKLDYCRYATQEGTRVYGSKYTPTELPTGKKAFYGFLRVVVRPLRYLF